MPKDTRVSQIQTKQLVITGSNALLVYPVSKQDSANPNQGLIDQSQFPTGSIGQDVLFFVSGAVDGKNSSTRLISAFGGDLHISGNLTVDGTTIINDTMNYLFSLTEGVAESSGSIFVSGALKAFEGLSGSLTTLADGTPFLVAGENVTLTTGSNGSVTVAGSPGFFISDTADLAETSGSVEVTGSLTVYSGITGALNVLPDGSPAFLAGPAMIITTGSNGQVTFEALTGSVGAPGAVNEVAYHGAGAILTASAGFAYNPSTGFLTVDGGVVAPALSGSHTTLADGSPAFLAEGGISLVTESNGAVTFSSSLGVIDHGSLTGRGDDDHTQYTLADGTRAFSGDISHGGNNITNVGDVDASTLTGSLTEVAAGTPYIQVIGGLSIVTQSNGSLQLSGTQGISDHGQLVGLADDDHTQYALVDGTRDFTGDVTAPGFSGSLTTLSDGSPYLLAGTAVTLSTGSNGAITIGATPGATLAAGGENEIQYNVAGALSASTNLWVDAGTSLNVTGALVASGDLSAAGGTFTDDVTATGFTGSLTRTSTGTSFIVTSNGLSVSTGSAGQVTISGNPMSASIAQEINDIQADVAAAGFGLWYSNTSDLVEASGSASVSGTLTAQTASFLTASIANTLNINGAWAFFGETEGGTERLVLQGTDANDASELFLQSKGAADTARITLSPDENTNNYGGIEFNAGAASNSVNVIAQGSGDIRPFKLLITGSAIVEMATNGDMTFSTGSVLVKEDLTVNGAFNSVDATITGSITRTSAGTNYIVASNGLSTSTGSNGQITVSGQPLSGAVATHIDDATLHFTEGSIDHTAIQNIGTNTHAQIDSHIADATLHFTEASIDHGSIAGLGDDDHTQYLLADGTRALAGNLNLGGNNLTNGGIISAEFTGSLTRTSAGTNFIISAGSGVTTSTGSAGQVTIDASPLSSSVASDINDIEGQLAGSSAWIDYGAFVGTSSSVQTSGSLTVKSGITGALNVLADGNDFIAGTNGVVTSTGSNGQVGLSFDSEYFFETTRNFSGTELFLADTDNNSLIYVSNSSNVSVHAPSTLSDGFEVGLVQQASGKLVFQASGSLLYPADFAPSSSQENSFVGLFVSGTNKDVYLAGELKLGSAASAENVSFTAITNFTSSNVQDAIAEVNVISSSLKSDISTNASDISNNTATINYVSNSLFFPDNVVDSSNQRFLSNQDSGRVIFMSGSTTNTVDIPPGLTDGFNCVLIQDSAQQIIVQATASLKYPSTFKTGSAEQNSMVAVYSGSQGLFLGGDLELA